MAGVGLRYSELRDLFRPIPSAPLGLVAFGLVACSAAPSTGSLPRRQPPPAGPAVAEVAAPTADGRASWATYHGNNERAGVGPSTPTFGDPVLRWRADLDAEIYAEPLAINGRLIVVTENDTAYALDASSGEIIWEQHVADPVPLSSLPCGNIDPSGFTSTPVIDSTSNIVYAVGRVQPTHHELYAFNVESGSVLFHRSVDPPGDDPRFLQQRGALALANGRVYVAFGGNFGDCGPYHGWVVGVNADGSGDLVTYQVPTPREAGIWAPPGPAVDGDGSLLVATGNGESEDAFDYANAVVRLSPDLELLDYWAPANWASLSATDTDVGSIGPMLVGAGQVLQSGKNGMGYLLRASALGGIGGELFSARVCRGAYGGAAYEPPTLIVPCVDGLAAIEVDDGAFRIAWRAGEGQLNSPIIAYGSVWSIDQRNAALLQIDPTDGSIRSRTSLDGPIRAHFTTPSAVGDALFVPAGHSVLAFGAPP
ncbi:MAG TPA: PQQ-binding-like beta-propeller repeat protein [Chloroflexota bacterium]|nr:PQQ-binding-like beta-propeller repeat protein [Chloroflexota bacterium]